LSLKAELCRDLTYTRISRLGDITEGATLVASTNIFEPCEMVRPLLAHTMPWTAMAALKVVQTREY